VILEEENGPRSDLSTRVNLTSCAVGGVLYFFEWPANNRILKNQDRSCKERKNVYCVF
jgi:hypothetical protein